MINFFKKYFALLLIFIMYEGFGLLPQFLVVPIPGVFRLTDSFLLIVFIVYILNLRKIGYIFREHTQASIIILFGCLMFITGIFMAQFHFGQPILTGFLKLRQNFNLLLFFIILMLIYNEKEVTFFVRGISVIVCFIGVLAVIQYIIPDIPIFQGRDIDALYSGEKLLRYGSYRIIFPAAHLAVLLYCYILGELIEIEKPNKFYLKVSFLIFLFFLFYIQQIRATILTITIVSIYALFTCKKTNYKVGVSILLFMLICGQLLSFAISNQGLSDLENSKIYYMTKSVLNAFDSDDSSINARFEQTDMYLHYFKKYPVLGSGTLAIESPLSKKYQLYNTSDLGYFKLLCEYGMVGFFWFVWLFVYVHRRTKKILAEKSKSNIPDIVIGITKGTRLFYMYIGISMLTLPHFSRGSKIIYMMISIAFLEIVAKLSTQIRAKP